MRYISNNSRLALYTTNGNIAHQFNQGVLIVGSPTTGTGAGNSIDPTTVYWDGGKLMEVFPADLAGVTTAKIEMMGQGSLADPLGASIGLRGYFFESPILTATTASVPAKEGIHYKVSQGTVTYAGVTYKAGQIFTTDGTTTATTSTGKFFIIPPPNSMESDLNAMFEEKHLQFGDEVRDAWLPEIEGGFIPRSEFTTTDIATGIGYLR